MGKHILDRSRKPRETALAKAVAEGDKVQPHRGTLALQRRTRLRDAAHRQARFLRIARTEAVQ